MNTHRPLMLLRPMESKHVLRSSRSASVIEHSWKYLYTKQNSRTAKEGAEETMIISMSQLFMAWPRG